MDFELIFNKYKEQKLYGRYVTNNHIEPLLKELEINFQVSVLGYSVLNKPVYGIKAGQGKIKIFIWSQMHGNEATTSKAIFDFLNLLKNGDDFAAILRQNFSFYILPIVNPDGAELYKRENANNIDLNRDSVNLSQPESKILRTAFEEFKPDYCYNMHDQRSIFGVGDTGRPATVSFLAPSYNDARDINASRQKAINLIAAMNDVLQRYISGQVGRFDDSFNINCIGDMFQSLNVPTVLFEAGHFQDDYIREKTRKFIFIALLSGFRALYENVIVINRSADYFAISQNKVIFYDIIYKNVKINYENKEKITNFASHYKEVLFEDSIILEARIKEVGPLEGFYGHREYDGKGASYKGKDGSGFPKNEEKADFYLGVNREFVNGVEES